MPPRRRTNRKQARKGRKNIRRARKSSNVRDAASLSVKRSLVAPGSLTGFLPNTLYNLMNTSLKDFTRATTVANAYQYYRIKKIALTVKPTYDTYQAVGVSSGGAAGLGKPNFYYMIDKSGAIPNNISLEGLKQMGARPRQLDEKNMTISWAPTVLEASMSASGASPTSTPAKYIKHPWLTTNANIVAPGVFVPSDVDHLGIYWYVDQAAGVPTGETSPTYQCELEVQFEFKKPLTVLSSSTEAVPAAFAEINRSADGIVGGNDGV